MASLNLMIGLPLIVFAIIDAYAPLKTALIGAVIISIIECLFTYFYFGRLDSVSYLTVVLVIGLAALSYKKQSPLFFKMKPAIMSLIFGSILIGSWLIDEPLMRTFMNKYSTVLEDMLDGELKERVALFHSEIGQIWLEKLTMTSGVAIFLHGIISAFAAYRLSMGAWLVISVAGFFVMSFIGVFFAQFLL